MTNDFHKVSTEFWDDLGAMKKLTKMIVPGLPTGFVPYVMHNKPFITHLQLGELNNPKTYHICHNLRGTLQSFHFTGGYVTYSGLVSILQCMDTLKVSLLINLQHHVLQSSLNKVMTIIVKRKSPSPFIQG